MSMPSSGTSNNNNQQAQARAKAQEQQNQQNQQQAKAFEKASTPSNPGQGFGGGRVTFDKSGNTLQDGKIVQFAGQQAKETFLAKQGLGNNYTITDPAKFAVADFRGIANYNIEGNKQEPGYTGSGLNQIPGPVRFVDSDFNPSISQVP